MVKFELNGKKRPLAQKVSVAPSHQVFKDVRFFSELHISEVAEAVSSVLQLRE